MVKKLLDEHGWDELPTLLEGMIKGGRTRRQFWAANHDGPYVTKEDESDMIRCLIQILAGYAAPVPGTKHVYSFDEILMIIDNGDGEAVSYKRQISYIDLFREVLIDLNAIKDPSGVYDDFNKFSTHDLYLKCKRSK